MITHGCLLIIGIAQAATAAGFDVDLRGSVTDPEGAGINKAFVRLLETDVADTTDSSGVFNLYRKSTLISDPSAVDKLPPASSADGTEYFDIAGRLIAPAGSGEQLFSGRQTSCLSHRKRSAFGIVIARTTGNSGCFVRKRIGPVFGNGSGTGRPRSRGLSKKSSTSGVIEIIRDGYRKQLLPISDFTADLGSIPLQMEDTFTVRTPVMRSMECNDPLTGDPFEMSFPETDLVCRCANDSLHATLYFQSQADSCTRMLYAEYAVTNAWIRVDGIVQPLDPVRYVWGGNHHNDRVIFSWNGNVYSFYHSSFGAGWRACIRPDCMQICGDEECRTILYDGCERSSCPEIPPLRVTCVQVNADGTIPELIDPWMPAGSDDSPAVLPCPGDGNCEQQ